MPHRHDQLLSRSKLYTSTLPKSSQVFEHILDHTDAEAIRWPEEAGHLSAEAVELVVELLHPLPDRRLGADGLATLRDHPFFGANGVDWALLQERVPADPSGVLAVLRLPSTRVGEGSQCGWPPLHLALLRGESHLPALQLLPAVYGETLLTRRRSVGRWCSCCSLRAATSLAALRACGT
jgi:hypothetical protein